DARRRSVAYRPRYRQGTADGARRQRSRARLLRGARLRRAGAHPLCQMARRGSAHAVTGALPRGVKPNLTTRRENCRLTHRQPKPPMNFCTAIEPAYELAVDRARLIEANINPVTGLATDYLNHFNEAIMMLELAPQVPECIDDFCAWRPLR